jgi:hypothetical protein
MTPHCLYWLLSPKPHDDGDFGKANDETA